MWKSIVVVPINSSKRPKKARYLKKAVEFLGFEKDG